MIKYLITLATFLFLEAGYLLAQTGPIQLDRPDQTECPFIVPEKYIQFESGLTFENINEELKNISHPTVLWKYGLNEKFEFRLITELVSVKDAVKTSTGLNPITIGFKTNICKENGLIPTTSFIGHLTTAKFGKKEFQTSYVAPSFRFTMQHTLSDKLSLAYNVGAEWDGESAAPIYIYTLTTGISFTDKLGGYAEVYGFAPDNGVADHNFDCGLTYLLKYDMMMDLSGGFGLTDNALRNYISLGFSYRFKAIK